MIETSARTKNLPFKKMDSVFAAVEAARSYGITVHNTLIGQPRHSPPESYLEYFKNYDEKFIPYESCYGVQRLREAWAAYLNKICAADTTAQSIIITQGASEAILYVLAACCSKEEYVLTFNPSYLNYLSISTIAGIEIRAIDRFAENDFSMDFNRLEFISHLKNSHCRAVLISNPENPSGKHWSMQEIETLALLCRKHDKFLIVDEVYRQFVYDDRTAISAIPLCRDFSNVIVVDSVSKQFGLCGARVGCLITTNKDIISEITVFSSSRLCVSTMQQYAVARMLETIDLEYVSHVVSEFEAQRNALVEAANASHYLKAIVPAGGIFSILKAPIDDMWDFAEFLAGKFHVSNETLLISPASSFYFRSEHLGTNQMRLPFTETISDVRKFVSILDQGIQSYTEQRQFKQKRIAQA